MTDTPSEGLAQFDALVAGSWRNGGSRGLVTTVVRSASRHCCAAGAYATLTSAGPSVRIRCSLRRQDIAVTCGRFRVVGAPSQLSSTDGRRTKMTEQIG
jgi:hypothetical protein